MEYTSYFNQNFSFKLVLFANIKNSDNLFKETTKFPNLVIMNPKYV